MSPQNKIILTIVTIMACALVSSAKTQKLTGKIVAYDLLKHNAKTSSALQNQEVVVLETPGRKQKYAKVIFSSFGTTQIEQQYFDGTQPLSVDVFRDRACDENSPRFIPQVSVQQMAGTYLLTNAFEASPPARIKTLECYDAIQKKKK